MFSVESIISYFKKTFTKFDVLIVFCIIFLYAITRLTNLEHWPIFSDEGIYIRWAHVAWKDAAWRFISVTDGRQPLQTWATIPFLKLFPENMLLAGRLFSVTTGFIGLVGMYSLLMYLWGKRAAMIGATLHVFLPYFVFYDRMALVDSAVNAGFIWIFFFSILLIRNRRLDFALILGFIGGFALLAKSSSRMFLMLAATAPLMYIQKTKKKIITQSINFYILLGVSFGISLLFYNVQRLSPFFHYVSQKNTTFVMTFDEFLKTPFAYAHNFRYIPLYISWEAGWLIVPLSIIGLYLLYKKDSLFALYLSLFILLPYIAISLFAKILFPRYVLFYGSILIITATYFFVTLKKKPIGYIIFGVLLVSMGILNYPLLFDPVRANFPPVDRGQYISGVTSVWGAEDLMNLMREKSQSGKVLILAEGDFGLIADVLKVYLHDDDNDRIEIRGLWPLDERHFSEFQHELLERQVFIVFSHREEFPEEWPIKFTQKYEKPEGDKAVYVYELLPIASEFSIISKK